MKRTLTFIAILTLVSSSLLLGHDPKKHHGKPITGTVEKLTERGMQLRTEKGTRTIVFTDKTVFENGDHPITRADIKPNQQVLVFGTTLPTDEVFAKEVLLSPSEAQTKETAHRH